MPELLSALLTARPGPQQPDLVLDTESGDQKVEEEEWRLDQDQAAVCDTSGRSLPAGSVLATLQAAQQKHFGGAEEAFLSLMAEGDADYSTLVEVITGAEMADKKTVPADVLTRLKLLQRMAVATTSNGVSVVVTLRRDEERQWQCGGGGGGGGWVLLNGRRFQYKISLIDIELKPLASKPDENNKRHFIQRGCQKHSHSICYVCNSSIVSGKPDLSAVLTPWAVALVFALGGLGWAGLRRTGIKAWA